MVGATLRGMSSYADRARWFAGRLRGRAEELLLTTEGGRAEFAAAVEAAARDMRVRGLAPSLWRQIVERTTTGVWENGESLEEFEERRRHQ